ncbi:MAG: SBBP repeat-containing protein [bacterium]
MIIQLCNVFIAKAGADNNAERLIQQFESSGNTGLRFEENMGQVVDQHGFPRNDVLLIGKLGNLKIILTQKKISYQFESLADGRPSNDGRQVTEDRRQKTEDRSQNLADGRQARKESENSLDKLKMTIDNKSLTKDEIFNVQRVDVEFVDANKNIGVITLGKSKDYVNYIRAGSTQPVTYTCYSYDTVIYKNVYENIDIVFYSGKQQSKDILFKYDFIVHEGGKVSDIKLKYNGCSDIFVKDGKLCIKAGDYTFYEYVPLSYLSGQGQFPIEVGYELTANVLSFKTNKYNKTESLTIDPYFIYATYYGGSGEDVGMEVAADSYDNYFVAGYSSSTGNIATTGAYQTDMKGEKDAFLVKFSSDGTRQWATYFGGSNFDFGHSLACDITGNVYMAGWTQTRTGIASLGAFQYNYGGGEFDAFLTKFSGSGILAWSTYFGAQYEDYINDVVVDGRGDLVFIGRTSSPSNISTALGFQVEFGGNFDAFLQKFNSNGNRIWGTYYGGEGFDVGMELCTDIFNNINITGYTQSKTGMASTGAFKDSLDGIWDAFIAKFDRNGMRIWGTYYGGSDDDNGWGIGSDGSGNILVTGNTNSFQNISTAGAHKVALESSELDAFVVKFNAHGGRVWGTYFGGEDEEYGNAGVVDAWENFIFSGNTLSDTGISTFDAPQIARSSQRDAFVAKLNNSGEQIFGTFYGGGLNEFGHGVTVGLDNRLLMTGYSLSPNLLTTSDAHQSSFGGTTDAFLVKIGDAMPLDSIWTEEFTDILCADEEIMIPYEVSKTFTADNIFIAQLSNTNGKFTEFYNIGTLSSITSGTITGRIPRETRTGTKYRIRVIGNHPRVIGDDNGLDISIYELPDAKITGDNIVCNNERNTYKANKLPNMNYKWYVTGGNIDGADNSDKIEVLWGTEGTGFVKLVVINTISGCNDSSEKVVAVYPEITGSSILGPGKLCPNRETIYYCIRDEGILNHWVATGGTIMSDSTEDTVAVKWDEVKTGKLMLIQTSDESGCKDTNWITVELYDLPKPLIIGDSVVKAKTTVVYRTSSLSKYSYFWTVEGGTIDGSAGNNVVYVIWKEQGYGTVCLHQTDKETGCEDSLKIVVSIRESAEEFISGNIMVCSFSNERYRASDTNYNYNWKIGGGILIGDSTGNEAEVVWDSAGTGFVLLIREDKSNSRKDTLILDIEILETPEFTIKGIENVCEGVVKTYKTEIEQSGEEDISKNIIYSWMVSEGSIIGDDRADSVIVFWNRIKADSSVSYLTGKIGASITDTTNNCTSNKSLEVVINRTPTVEFTGDTLVCENELREYKTVYKEGMFYLWHISGGIITANSGDTSITVKWGKQSMGFVQVLVGIPNGCSDSLMKSVTINRAPEKPVITQSGKMLISSADEGNQWYLSSILIEGAESKYYSPEVSGIYTVQVSSDNGCYSEMSSPYSFNIDDVDVDDFIENEIVLFPNPTSDIINIKFNLLYYDDIDIKVYNLIGRCVYTGRWRREKGKEIMDIDLAGFTDSVYLLTIKPVNGYLRNFRVIKY